MRNPDGRRRERYAGREGGGTAVRRADASARNA